MLNQLTSIPALITAKQLTIVLIVVSSIFIVLIAIAIIKMYKLKAENKKLMDTNAFKDIDDSYKDFTSGHLYDDV